MVGRHRPTDAHAPRSSSRLMPVTSFRRGDANRRKASVPGRLETSAPLAHGVPPFRAMRARGPRRPGRADEPADRWFGPQDLGAYQPARRHLEDRWAPRTHQGRTQIFLTRPPMGGRAGSAGHACVIARSRLARRARTLDVAGDSPSARPSRRAAQVVRKRASSRRKTCSDRARSEGLEPPTF